LKVPVMPVRLFKLLRCEPKAKKKRRITHLNFAENAWAGYWVWVGFEALLDWNLIKLARGIGDISGKERITLTTPQSWLQQRDQVSKLAS
jgi:hypothetical protein